MQIFMLVDKNTKVFVTKKVSYFVVMGTKLSAWVFALVLVLVVFYDVGSLNLLLICRIVALNTVKM
jgi:hypothetical protein